MPRDPSVKSLHKCARILDCFTKANPVWSLSGLANHLGMHTTTTFRLLTTLQEVGFISQDSGTRHYRLGLKLLELGARVRDGLDVVREAEDILQDLARECRESTYLSILRDGYVVYVSAVDAAQEIKTSATMGERRPLHSTATGKVFLAHMTAREREAYLRLPLAARGPNTLTDPLALEATLAQVLEAGYAFSYEEDHPGLVSVAAPVFGYEGVVAALSLAGPAFRLPREVLPGLSSKVVAAAGQLSRRLGARATL